MHPTGRPGTTRSSPVPARASLCATKPSQHSRRLPAHPGPIRARWTAMRKVPRRCCHSAAAGHLSLHRSCREGRRASPCTRTRAAPRIPPALVENAAQP